MSGKAAKRILKAVCIAAALAVLFLIGARGATVLVDADAANPAGGLVGLIAYGGLERELASGTWHLALGDWRVAASGIAFAAIPALIGLAARARQDRLKEDTMAAHGNARLAEESEMGDLVDTRVPSNNIRYTEHAGICRTPWDRKTKEMLYGRNLNCITLGISGQGKTYNLATPDIMQATGDALVPYRRGYASRAADLIRYRGKLPITQEEARPRRIPAKARAAGADAGSDLVITDPKGGMLLDTGRMLEAAGYDIRCFNTVNFAWSCHVNPFAYVDHTECDSKPAEEASIRIEVSVTQAGATEKGSRELFLAGPEDRFEFSSGAVAFSVRRRSATEEREVAGAEIAGGDGTIETALTQGAIEVTCANMAAAPASVEATIVIDKAMKVDDAAYGDARSATFNKPHESITSREWMDDPQTIRIALSLASQPAPRRERYMASIPVSIARYEIPNGAGLTKLVDTLVANLGGTDAAANKSEDPFWDDTKRLAFMSLAAYLVERYGHSACTIPNIMMLLNHVLSDSGDPHARSAVRELMDQWEYGVASEAQEAPASLMEAAPAPREVEVGPAHPRERSLAVMCYRAFTQAADDTVLSIIISCRAALSALMSEEIQEVLSSDELHLERLGAPGQKSAVFCVVNDTNSPFDFLTAMVIQLAIDVAKERADNEHGGRLPRHVRYILDEVANLGKIPVLIRAIAVVRSRNMSISMFVQSKSQIEMVYGKQAADSIMENCTTWLFLGAQMPENLQLISDKIGDETVFMRVMNRSFNAKSILASSSSESVSSTGRKVRSATQLQQMASDTMLCFIYNHLPIEDKKIRTQDHPLYRYINPGDARSADQPPAAFAERFDYAAYLREARAREGVAA